jgi:hypothetical protein
VITSIKQWLVLCDLIPVDKMLVLLIRGELDLHIIYSMHPEVLIRFCFHWIKKNCCIKLSNNVGIQRFLQSWYHLKEDNILSITIVDVINYMEVKFAPNQEDQHLIHRNLNSVQILLMCIKTLKKKSSLHNAIWYSFHPPLIFS